MNFYAESADPPRSLQIALIMSFVGGFLDAYSFASWGGVFAGAQSGNVILMAISVARGEWHAALRKVPSLLAFAAGVLTAVACRVRRERIGGSGVVVLTVEALILLLVGLASSSLHPSIAIALMAFVAGLQLTFFGRIGGWTYNSTMTTGNLRNLLEAVVSAVFCRSKTAMSQVLALGLSITAFSFGAGVGGISTYRLHGRAICIAVPVLLLAACVLPATGFRSTSAASQE